VRGSRARTTMIAPGPASRAWRARWARRSRSIRAGPTKFLRPRARSAADVLAGGKAINHVHLPRVRTAAESARIGARSRALRLRARRLFVLGLPADAVVGAAASAMVGAHRLRPLRPPTFC